MNFRKLLIITVLCAFPFALSAQSIADINAAKKLAESYGYSESEINDLINKKNGSNKGKNSRYSRDEYDDTRDSVEMGRMGKDGKGNRNSNNFSNGSSEGLEYGNDKQSDVKPIFDKYGNLLNPEDFEDLETSYVLKKMVKFVLL